jgi:pilus assembly protein CpaB
MFSTLPTRRVLLLAIAMLLSLVTALVLRAWVLHVRGETVSPVTTSNTASPTMVLVAAKALPSGHFIRSEDLTWQSWPNSNLSKAYMVKGAVKLDSIVGSVVKTGIAPGEPVTDLLIVKKGDRGFLAAIIRPGYRAFTVSLQQGAGLSGLTIPGDRVDLILTMDVPGAGKNGMQRRMSETVLQDVRVLAIDQDINDQKHNAPLARTATLELTPKQAEVVTLLNEMGKLSMTLRSVGSAENDALPHHPTLTWDSEAVYLPYLYHGPTGSAVGDRIDVVRGTNKSSIEFRGGHVIESAALPPTSEGSGAPAVGAATAKTLGTAGRAAGR